MPPLPISIADRRNNEKRERTFARQQKPSLLRKLIFFTVATAVVIHTLWGIPDTVHKLHTCHRARDCSRFSALDDRARCILSNTPLIDGHVDFPLVLRLLYGNQIEGSAFREAFENGTLPGQVDLYRLRQGASGGAFWSVYAPCPKDDSDFSDENYAASVKYTLDQIDVTNRLQKLYPNDFSQAVDSKTALRAFKLGKLISPLGVEGLHQIGNKVSNLRLFYDLGVRYATLTHNCHNKFADAAILDGPTRKAPPKWHGLSPIGRKLIHEMNRIGMIVDLAHVSDDTMRDVLGGNEAWEGSKAPVIHSHSSAHSICPHPRNVNDDILQLVKRHKSLVMVNIAPEFISCIDNGNENGIPDPVPEKASIQQVARHILHIGNLIGFDHVGVGTDFDGIPTVPEGFSDVSKYPDLVAELLNNGVSDSDAAKVIGGNLLRVWAGVDAVAAELQAAGVPALEDEI